jgi:hypothetical protein
MGGREDANKKCEGKKAIAEIGSRWADTIKMVLNSVVCEGEN